MANNPVGAVDAALEVFGGWVTEMDAVNLPAGVSPECPESAFVPGSVYTRPGFRKVFNPPLAPNTTINYGKSFVAPDKTIYNFYLSSSGDLYLENLTTSPGTATVLFTTFTGLFARSVTAFGREYIAISDGFHGADAPLQYDGEFLDRVTQDGPGKPPLVTSVIIPPSQLSGSPYTANGFVVIPLTGVGSIAIGCGSAADGTSITLPVGYNTTDMVAWCSPQNGFDATTQIEGVHDATVTLGVVSAHFQKRDGTQGFAANGNWVAACWTSGASVTVTTSGAITYVEFTTSEGDDLCIANGSVADGASMGGLPAGFVPAQFANIAGPATTTHTGNGLQQVQACNVDAALLATLTYGDRTPTSGNHWHGDLNVFGIFWKMGGGVTTSPVTNGSAIIVPTSGTTNAGFVMATTASTYGVPFPGSAFLVSACAMSGGAASADHVDHGFQSCQVAGQTFTGLYGDGGGHVWGGTGNIFAINTDDTATPTTEPSLVRLDNTVTATTVTPHGLKVGYLVQISNVPASAVGGGITSIVIDNESDPGLATVTTASPHGLLPQNNVTITGVTGTAIGGAITSVDRQGQIVTVVTSAPHTLTPGVLVTIAGVTDVTFNTSTTVAQIVDPVTFTYLQADTDATSSGGTVTLAWPIPDNTPTPTYFEVQAAPTATTFQVQVSYANGTWTGGVVSFAWNGYFYVTAIDSPTVFEYRQYGPDASSAAAGTATPYGQAAPGVHRVRQSFLTRQGFLTKPSPWFQFVANGGQYLQIDRLAIGPDNIKARVIEFTGALGSQFFYLPVNPQADGLTVGQATQINDNTTTDGVIFDFSDNSLFAGLCTSIPGNNTPAQITLDGALGFASFDTEILAWGQRNTVTNLLNMDFAGGTQPTSAEPFVPTGWTSPGIGGTAYFLVPSRVGSDLRIPPDALGVPIPFSQPAYEDIDGAPILIDTTRYKFRAWLSGLNGDETLTATISSVSTGFTTSVTLTAGANAPLGAYQEATFDLKTPIPLPQDITFTVTGLINSVSGELHFSQMSLIYADTPFTDSIINTSYSNNPEAFDGVTGKTGPSDDPRPVTDFSTLNDIPYALTREPSGRLHEITATGTTLPAGWIWNEKAANCGVLSAFSLTKSQADDNSSSGGEEWFAWGSESGARIFGGNQPWKISQEIQPNWFDQQSTNPQINMQAAYTSWTLNDPVGRVLYFGLPLGHGLVPTVIYQMSYRELDTAEQIAFAPPYRTSFTGRLIATDNTRKWSPWYRSMNGAARMYREAGELTPVFFAGNGSVFPPGFSGPGLGNVYSLDTSLHTDDDYGQIISWYTTCALPTHDQEVQLQLGSALKLLPYLTGYIAALGNLTITVYANNLSNPWPLVCLRQPGLNPNFDLEWTGGNCVAQRMFFKIQPSPLVEGETDNYYNLNRLVPYFRKNRFQVRGSSH